MKCPYCSTTLTTDDWYDHNLDDNSGIAYLIGHCETCGREFEWERRYKFVEETGLSEIEAS